jgi:hypothetical protein
LLLNSSFAEFLVLISYFIPPDLIDSSYQFPVIVMLGPNTEEKVNMPAIDTGDNQSQNADVKQSLTTNADKAASFLLNTEGYAELTLEAEKKLKRKIDLFMIPMV